MTKVKKKKTATEKAVPKEKAKVEEVPVIEEAPIDPNSHPRTQAK